MSWRELRVFLRYLPPESKTAREICPPDPVDEWWTPDRLLMATLIDSVRLGNYFQVKLHGDPQKTKFLKPPKPIERPGVSQPDNVIRFGGRHGSGAAGLAQLFGGAQAS